MNPTCLTRLDRFRPAVAVTIEYDPLRDEGERYADRLEEAEVTMVWHRYAGTIHGFL